MLSSGKRHSFLCFSVKEKQEVMQPMSRTVTFFVGKILPNKKVLQLLTGLFYAIKSAKFI